MKDTKKIKILYIIPCVHLALSFLWEWLVLIPKERSSVAFSLPMNTVISDSFEQVMCYTISKIMTGVIIFVLWHIIFSLFDRKKTDRETVIIFGIILVISLLITLLLWPDVFEAGGDNFIPYSYAIRLMPEYWHSIYLTCLYTASVMIVPHAASINLLQTVLFVLAVGYLYNRIKMSDSIIKSKWVRFLVFPLFILRDTFTVMTNPERAEYNVAFTFFFLSLIAMDIIEKKKRPLHQQIILLIYASFLAVFRSEGIIVASLSFIALMVFVYKPKAYKFALVIICLLGMIIVFKLPGKVGDIKYYGSDYSIVNSFNPLHNIFISDSSNLSYEGVENDLEAIGAITPVNLIEEFASEGYRRYNYSQGYADINQSRAGKEISAAYKQAYRNIVLHNVPIYVKTQASMFLQAIGAIPNAYVEEYKGESSDFPSFGQELWQVGRDDFQVIPGRFKWERFGLRNTLAAVFTIPRLKYVDILTKSRIYTVFFALELLIGLLIPIIAVINYTKNRKKDTEYSNQMIEIGAIAVILDMYVTALALVMPVGANMYFHTYIYCIFMVMIVFLGFINSRGRRNGI